MNSQITENYLKALFNLSLKNEDISVSKLGEMMQVSMPTANSMIKKLNQQGLVDYKKYKPIRLTKDGKKTAALIVRKHRLIEMFLVEVMDLGWEEVHDIAEQIEHVDSDRFFERMDHMLGRPTIDPHGSPIPDVNGKVPVFNHKKLSEFQVGQTVQLVALAQSSKELMEFLNKKDLKLGSTFIIKEKEAFDGSMTVQHHQGREVLISRSGAECLLVSEQPT